MWFIFWGRGMSTFYKEIAKLKNIVRNGWLECGLVKDRVESDAEHICSMCMIAMELMQKLDLKLD